MLKELIDYIEAHKVMKERENDSFTQEYCSERIGLAEKLINIAVVNNLIISKSPYSHSYYAHEKGEEITWGSKPEGSYRFSDHWNFGFIDDMHCLSDEIENEEIAIGMFQNGKYIKA